MDSLFWQRTKIPTALGILATVVLMSGLIFATSNLNKIQSLFASADQGASPVGSVKLANLTDSSFTVYWSTASPASGAVFYGKTPAVSDGVAVDDRDLTSPNGKYLTHLVRVSGLNANTKYYFKLGVNDPSIGDPAKNQAPFEVTTGGSLPPNSVQPIFGKANNSSDLPAAGAIVTWQSDGSSTLATLVKSDGSFVIPVGSARTADLVQSLPVKVGLPETINFAFGADGAASIKCVYGSDKPLPTVKTGQNLDCSTKTPAPAAAAPTTTTTPPTTTAHFTAPTPKARTTLQSQTGDTAQLNIVSGQSVSTPFPTISGKVLPKQVVKITVHSETPYSGTVVAGPDGSWSWTPPAGLSPGQHTVTITIVNSDGTTQTVTRDFTVSADNPLLPVTSGTPSAQPTHLACVKNACTTVTGSGVDSCSTNSDCAATVSAKPPVTGSGDNTTLLLFFGVAFLVLGGAFVVFNL